MNRTSKKTSLRVLHLVPRFIPGGATQVILHLATGMVEHGVQPLIAFGEETSSTDLDKLKIDWQAIPAVPSTPANAARCFFALRRLVKQRQISLIHSHHRFTSVVGRLVAMSLNIPFVCTVHDLAVGNSLISRYGCGKTVTVFSQAVKDHLVRKFGIPSEYIHKITMGIPLTRQPVESEVHALRKQYNCSPPIPVISFAGRLATEKGPQVFLEAASQVLTKVPESKFWIIGDGELRLELEELAHRLGIAQSVIFWGWRDDLTMLFACSDLVVVPSLREGFGITALEALRAGKAVIASNVGGLPEIVQNGRNGLLVSAGEPATLAKAIVSLLKDRGLLRDMGQRAQTETLDRFDQKQMVEGFLDLYSSMQDVR